MCGLNFSFWLVTTRVLLLRSRYFQVLQIDPQSGQKAPEPRIRYGSPLFTGLSMHKCSTVLSSLIGRSLTSGVTSLFRSSNFGVGAGSLVATSSSTHE